MANDRYRDYMNDTLWYEIFKVLRKEFPKLSDKRVDDIAEAVVDAQVRFTLLENRDEWGV